MSHHHHKCCCHKECRCRCNRDRCCNNRDRCCNNGGCGNFLSGLCGNGCGFGNGCGNSCGGSLWPLILLFGCCGNRRGC